MRRLMLCAVGAVLAVSHPAMAITTVEHPVNCKYSQKGWGQFKATKTGTWDYWATYKDKWGPDDTGAKTKASVVAGQTYTVYGQGTKRHAVKSVFVRDAADGVQAVGNKGCGNLPASGTTSGFVEDDESEESNLGLRCAIECPDDGLAPPALIDLAPQDNNNN